MTGADAHSLSREDGIWSGDEKGLARQLEQRYGVRPLSVHREYYDDDVGEVVHDALAYEPDSGGLLLAVDLEIHTKVDPEMLGIPRANLPPEAEVRERALEYGPGHQCPQCEAVIAPWTPCARCDFYDLDWWTERTGDEPTDEQRVERAFFALDHASSSLSVIEERVPQLEVSDDWDADAIRNVNERLDSLQSAVSDVSGEVAAASLALNEVTGDAG